MDHLNAFMAEIYLPQEMRARYRDYFQNIRHLLRQRHYDHLLEDMSPRLREDIANYQHGGWVSQVTFFCCGDDDEEHRFVTKIALNLGPLPPPRLILLWYHLYFFILISFSLALTKFSSELCTSLRYNFISFLRSLKGFLFTYKYSKPSTCSLLHYRLDNPFHRKVLIHLRRRNISLRRESAPTGCILCKGG